MHPALRVCRIGSTSGFQFTSRNQVVWRHWRNGCCWVADAGSRMLGREGGGESVQGRVVIVGSGPPRGVKRRVRVPRLGVDALRETRVDLRGAEHRHSSGRVLDGVVARVPRRAPSLDGLARVARVAAEAGREPRRARGPAAGDGGRDGPCDDRRHHRRASRSVGSPRVPRGFSLIKNQCSVKISPLAAFASVRCSRRARAPSVSSAA